MSSLINNILFPTDFSDNARNALPFALEFSKRTGATLHILHSIEEPYDFAPMAEEVKKGVTRKVQRLFEEMLDEIRKEKKYADIPIHTHIQTGRALYTIPEESENLKIDMIVMGTKGRSGLEKILFGTTTAEVVQLSKVPVLAVPQKTGLDDFDQILFTTDYNDGDLVALAYIAKLAKLFQSKIKIFHAALDNDLKTDIMFRGFRELIREKIPYRNVDFDYDTTITFFEAVADQLDQNDISLLVMVRYQKPFSLLKKNYSKEMSYYTEVPLLVLPGTIE